jgi:hypothetical protein
MQFTITDGHRLAATYYVDTSAGTTAIRFEHGELESDDPHTILKLKALAEAGEPIGFDEAEMKRAVPKAQKAVSDEPATVSSFAAYRA